MSYFDDHWYVVERSARVGKRPRAITRFGERIVLFRDAGGALRALSARCPHRGADLGLGRVVDGTIECPYHGFRYDGEGRCTRMPCEGRARPIPERLRVPGHVVREHRGLVWMWRGAGAPTRQVPWMDALPPDERGSADGELTWDAPLARVIEGMMDMHHLPFAHRAVGMGGIGPLLDPFEARVEGDVIRTRGVLRADDGAPWDGERGLSIEIDVRFPSLVRLSLSRLLPGFVACTPIDAQRTWIVARFWVRIPILGALLARLALRLELALVQPDDQRMAETASPAEPELDASCPVRADAGIVLWHRLARRQRHPMAGPPPAHRYRLI